MTPNMNELIVHCPDCQAEMRYLGDFIEDAGATCVHAWHCDECDAEVSRPCGDSDQGED